MPHKFNPQRLLEILRLIAKGELEESIAEELVTLEELKSFPMYLHVEEFDGGMRMGITRLAFDFLQRNDPELAKLLRQQRGESTNPDMQAESSLRKVDWRGAVTEAELMDSFPGRPTSDEILDLWALARRKNWLDHPGIKELLRRF